ncbi:MAG TPA: 30S ribosomal protein S20 [Candidatus Acidoferrales bacterium]|nr:30S ribosomal protein S20 [Candidatus Acidoferrales bacterium]
MATAVAPKRKKRKKSVLKNIRQAVHRAQINRANRSQLRTQVKRFRRALASGNLAEARQLLPQTVSLLDRSVRKGILHRNAAARTKSRLLRHFQKLAGAAA